MKIHNPTKQQIAAWKRNWKLYQLKSAIVFLKSILNNHIILTRVENIARKKIDDQWQADSFEP